MFSSIVRQNDDIRALLTFHSYCRRLGVCFSTFFYCSIISFDGNGEWNRIKRARSDKFSSSPRLIIDGKKEEEVEGWNRASLIGNVCCGLHKKSTNEANPAGREVKRLASPRVRCSRLAWSFLSLSSRHIVFASDFIARLMRNRRDSVRMVTLNITSPEQINWVPISLMAKHAERESTTLSHQPRRGISVRTNAQNCRQASQNGTCVVQFILMETKTRFWAGQIFTQPSNVYIWQFFHSISIKANIDKGMVWLDSTQRRRSFRCSTVAKILVKTLSIPSDSEKVFGAPLLETFASIV